MTREIRNAIITSTQLGPEDHGILTCYIALDYGGAGQSFGGYGFDTFDATTGLRTGHSYGMEFIRRVLETLEVSSWEKLPGAHCRADSEHVKVHRIGHILKDQWFSPEDLAKEMG